MADISIIKNGRSNYSIVVSDDASVVEYNAANELATYFVKTANVHLKNYEESNAEGPCFYVGHTEFAKKNGIAGDSEENWKIAVIGENIVLTGGLTRLHRGICYAVYHFIEDCLGVRWWNEVEEYIPEITDFTIAEDFKSEGTPVFSERKVVSSFANYDFTYFAHNRINLISNGDNIVGRQFSRTALENGGAHYVGLPAMCHTMEIYYPAKEYFEKHPEWYGWCELEGRRHEGYQLCCSNKELAKDLLGRLLYNIKLEKRAAEHYHTDPPSYYSLTMADHQFHCQCPECKASIEKSGISGHYIKFVNSIAREVKKLHPDIYLETSGYWDMFEVPLDDTTPDENVKMRLAYMDEDVAHSINYPSNTHKRETMKKWGEICKKSGSKIWHWSYMFYDFPSFPMPALHLIPENLRAYREMGVDSCFVENEISGLSDFWAARQWLLCKFIENPYLDFEKVLTDFLEKYYGKGAAPYIREYIEKAHKECEESLMYIKLPQTASNWNYVTPMLLADGIKLFEKAFEEARGNAVLEQRLRETMAPIYKTIAIRRADLDRYMKLHNIFVELPTAKEAAEKVIDCLTEIRDKYTCKYGVTSVHTDKFFTNNVDKELSYFNSLLNDTEVEFKMPSFLENVKEEDVYDIPAYKITYLHALYHKRAEIVEDKDADSGKAFRYKGVTLAFTDNIKDVTKWNIPFLIYKYENVDHTVKITKSDLDGGDYKWIKLDTLKDVGKGTMTCLCVDNPYGLVIHISALTEVFPFEEADVWLRVKAEGHSFGGAKDKEDGFLFDRFVIVRR